VARNDAWVSFGPARGQNSTENPLALPPGTMVASNNVVLDPESSVAVKRRGSTSLSGTPTGTYLVMRHKPPASTEANAELWAFALDSGLKAWRKIGAAAFSSVTLPAEIELILRGVTLNGKLFFSAQTGATNRMYVWDGTVVRKVGLAQSAAPTVANTGVGTYAAVLRYYKVSWKIKDGVKVIAESELSPEVSFTPSGTGTAARVSRPAILDSATHWVVWGSADNITYYKLSSDGVVGSASFDDGVNPSAYSGEQPAEVGTFLPPPSVTIVITDGNRLLMAGQGTTATTAGTGETTPKTNRVWYTPVLGSSDQGDDERIPDNSTQVNYLDLGENTNDGAITELVGPIEGAIFAFTKRRIWKLIATGDLVTPYVTLPVSDRYGAIAGQNRAYVSAVAGEDEYGAPAIYFLSDNGIYRVGQNGVQFVSFEIQTEFQTIGQLANTSPWLFSYPQRKQLWLVTQPSSGNARFFIFQWSQGRPDTDGDIRGGWTTWTYAEALTFGFHAGCLHNTTPGTASAAAEILIPYLATNQSGAIRVFERAAATDGSTNYAGSVRYAPILPAAGQAYVRMTNPVLVSTAASGVSLRLSAIRDFGTETRTADVSLTAVGSETRVIRTVEGLFSADATAIELQIGDASANANLWQVDYLIAPFARQEPR
jgi:hypothetical protein